jgi:acyl-CoA reductase-like NAD-dependent aldehyde dehydrogenase
MAVLVARARQAQAAWAARPVADRLGAIKRLRHAIAAHASELAEAAGRSSVRPTAEAMVAEVLPLADACHFLEREAARLLRIRKLGASGRPAWLWGARAEIRRQPVGVVLVVGPSNYPLMLPGIQAVQALAAGNAVVWKPGRHGGPAAEAMARLMRGVGVDPGLCVVLPEETEAAYQAIEAGVDRVVLTGSTGAGRALAGALADRLVPATMELSGCDAAIVLGDADLDLVAQALAFGLRLNGGATCLAPHRVLVVGGRAAELGSRLAGLIGPEASRRLEPDESDRIGPLVREGLQRGARLVSGGQEADGSWSAPVVLEGVDRSARLMREDPFGPVVALVDVQDEADALRVATDCPYGLGASIFGDPLRARAMADKLGVGVVQINDLIAPTADPRLPFGGRRASGYGATRGAEGLLEMTRPQVVTIRSGRARPHYQPLDGTDGPLVAAYIRAAHGGRPLGRAGAVLDLIRGIVRKARMVSQQASRPGPAGRRR